MDILKTFGENLRKTRKKVGFSQEKLAEKTGLHRTYISFLERGLRNPTLTTIYKLSVELDINITDLFEN